MERTHVRCYTFEMGEKKICAVTGSNGYVGGCIKN